MTVAVIVPTFNRAEFLQQSLGSIPFSVQGMPVEVIVVDDGSTDATPQIIETLRASGRRLQYVRHDNSGIAVTRNVGLAALGQDTKFVTFLDSDDVMPRGALDAQLRALLSDPTLDLVYGRMLMTDKIDARTNAPAQDAKQLNLVGIQLSCALFRRGLLTRVGQFDTEFVQAEDTDYLLRVFESGARFVQTETICLFYRRHAQNLTRNLDESRRYFARALQKSIMRRRRDPTIRLVKPDFEVQQIGTMEL